MGSRGIHEAVRQKKNRLYDADKDEEPGSQPVMGPLLKKREAAANNPTALDATESLRDSQSGLVGSIQLPSPRRHPRVRLRPLWQMPAPTINRPPCSRPLHSSQSA